MLIDSIIEDDEKTLLPVKIRFEKDSVVFTDTSVRRFTTRDNRFEIYAPALCEASKCTSCNGCSV